MEAAVAASSAASSGSSVYTVSEEKTNGTRLARLLVDGGTHVLRKVLHSFHPTATLQNVLNSNRSKLRSRVKCDDQWENLFPPSGDPPDSNTFDITLLHLLLREICNLKEPPTGWHKMPADGDSSLEANTIRIKCHRNELCHSDSTGIRDTEFEDKWNKVSKSLVALGLDQQEIDRLKTDPIDHDTKRRVHEEVGKWKRDFEPRVQNLEQEVQQLKAHIQGPISGQTASCELSNCLPDRVRDVFGRSQEIQQVKDLVESGTVGVVLITGGPGFGKTTVAKEVAHELLTNPESEGTVLFCSLVTKGNVSEVATEMIDSFSRIHSHVPENPEQWLKDWSKQIKTHVTFVLDNADGVLESKDRSSFLKMLSAMRRLSRQNVTFVVTSRKKFNDSDLQPSVVELEQASVEEAKNILNSRVSNQDVPNKLARSERIVELCGGVPLALCIVGSLLSVCPEEKLIKYLEEEPLTVLDDGETSVENVIRTSFDFLTKPQRDALILMSVFPGQFNLVAVEAVMKASPSLSGIPPVLILHALSNRSLLEQPSLGRCQMHPLIQAFAKKIGKAEYPHLVAEGEKLACAHFMSRLAENADRYWRKDNCRESVDAFNADRHNLEYFLQMYAKERKKKNSSIVESCQTFLDRLPQKCMYLEMCVLPKFYTSILEKVLQTFESETRPVHRVELLCLLGHEYRKAGEKEKYRKLMSEADDVYRKNRAEFETNALSEVYFRNSYIRFLSDKKEVNERERIDEETEAVLQVSRDKLGEHPERAATLLYAGIFEKRNRRTDKAHQKFSEALELFKKCLGEHFMTAQSLKAIADMYFFLEAEDHLETCLEHYGAAIKMVDDLGMGGSKESILTLKNLGQCHMEKKNFEEAMRILMKAEQVSEQELEGDHPWKISIKTEQAILHDRMGNQDKAKHLMFEGLSMGKKLDQPIDKMGNKDKIKEFIDRYPETFPEKEFPRKSLSSSVH